MIALVPSTNKAEDRLKFIGEPEDWDSVAHHLRVAAEQYERDAATAESHLRAYGETLTDGTHVGYQRTAEQFRRQAAQAREFANIIEGDARHIEELERGHDDDAREARRLMGCE